MTDTQSVDGGQVAADFREAFDGKLPQAVLDTALAHLASRPLIAASNTDAVLTIGGLVGTQVECAVTGGPTFRGRGWALPFIGQSRGSIYSNDLERLYSQSTSFTIVTTPVYVSMIFLDDAGNALGSFQGGTIATSAGSFGGTGSWS